jgi:hypothetical protein
MAESLAKTQHVIRQNRRITTAREQNFSRHFSELGNFRPADEVYSSFSTKYPLQGDFAS